MKSRLPIIAGAALFAIALASASAPALAQTVTGTVNLTGNVQGRCSVVSAGGAASSSFTGTIALGTLDEADGTLAPGFETSASASPNGTSVTSRVVCTSASVALAIAADSLANGTRGTAPASGYSNEIDYTAEMQVALASGVNSAVTFSTATGATSSSSANVGRLAASGNNVTVKAYGFATKGSSSNLLVAGSYASTITVNIQPAA